VTMPVTVAWWCDVTMPVTVAWWCDDVTMPVTVSWWCDDVTMPVNLPDNVLQFLLVVKVYLVAVFWSHQHRCEAECRVLESSAMTLYH